MRLMRFIGLTLLITISGTLWCQADSGNPGDRENLQAFLFNTQGEKFMEMGRSQSAQLVLSKNQEIKRALDLLSKNDLLGDKSGDQNCERPKGQFFSPQAVNSGASRKEAVCVVVTGNMSSEIESSQISGIKMKMIQPGTTKLSSESLYSLLPNELEALRFGNELLLSGQYQKFHCLILPPKGSSGVTGQESSTSFLVNIKKQKDLLEKYQKSVSSSKIDSKNSSDLNSTNDLSDNPWYWLDVYRKRLIDEDKNSEEKIGVKISPSIKLSGGALVTPFLGVALIEGLGGKSGDTEIRVSDKPYITMGISIKW